MSTELNLQHLPGKRVRPTHLFKCDMHPRTGSHHHQNPCPPHTRGTPHPRSGRGSKQRRRQPTGCSAAEPARGGFKSRAAALKQSRNQSGHPPRTTNRHPPAKTGGSIGNSGDNRSDPSPYPESRNTTLATTLSPSYEGDARPWVWQGVKTTEATADRLQRSRTRAGRFQKPRSGVETVTQPIRPTAQNNEPSSPGKDRGIHWQLRRQQSPYPDSRNTNPQKGAPISTLTTTNDLVPLTRGGRQTQRLAGGQNNGGDSRPAAQQPSPARCFLESRAAASIKRRHQNPSRNSPAE